MPHSTMPKYRAPLTIGNDPIVSIAHWDNAHDEFENKKYKDSVISVLNFINPDLMGNKSCSEDITIKQAHGSAQIKITINNEKFRIVAPFLKIDQSNKIALMRRVAEINFNPLNLVQILLKDDILWFEFSSDIDLCQPNKIYDAIREVCKYCDDYDDEFIDKYNASFYHQPKVTPLSEADQETVWIHFREIAEQYKRYLDYFEQKRWLGSVWDILAISLFNLANMPYIHSTLRSELNEALQHLYDGSIDGNYRLDRGKSFLNDLFDETSKEDFLKNVYSAEKLISLKFRSSDQILQNEFEMSKERIQNELNEGQLFNASYTMNIMLLKLLYEYNLDDGHREAITQALEKAGGLETTQAANILKDVYINFLNGTVDSVARKKPSGFFAKLFG